MLDSSSDSPLIQTDMSPSKTGYVLTADHNILHLTLIARYSISDPIAYVFQNTDAERILQTLVTAETTELVVE